MKDMKEMKEMKGTTGTKGTSFFLEGVESIACPPELEKNIERRWEGGEGNQLPITNHKFQTFGIDSLGIGNLFAAFLHQTNRATE